MNEHVWPFSVDDETQLHNQEKATCEGMQSFCVHMTGQEFLTVELNGFDWLRNREEMGCFRKTLTLLILLDNSAVFSNPVVIFQCASTQTHLISLNLETSLSSFKAWKCCTTRKGKIMLNLSAFVE